MDKLKPCPFCGGKPVKMTSSDDFTSIGCLECNPVFGVMVQAMTEAEAIKAWNTRKWKTCRLELEEPNEDGVWWCSYCKSYHQHKSKYPWEYCPRCGAKVVSE